jgi:hypothetical protein
VAQLMGVDVSDSGSLGHSLDVTMDGPFVEGLTVVSLDEASRATWSVDQSISRDQVNQGRMQWHIAVVVQLANRHSQPVRVADEDHGVFTKTGQLAHSHARPSQELDHEATALIGVLGQCGHEFGCCWIVEELRQSLVGLGEIAGKDQCSARRIVIAPLFDPLEECAQQTKPMPNGVVGEPLWILARTSRQPPLVVFDMAPLNGGDADARWVKGHDALRQVTERHFGGHHRSRTQRHGELFQVGGHGGRHAGCSPHDVSPGQVRGRHWFGCDLRGCGNGVHRAAPTDTCASMASTALRYSLANQSSPKCR